MASVKVITAHTEGTSSFDHANSAVGSLTFIDDTTSANVVIEANSKFHGLRLWKYSSENVVGTTSVFRIGIGGENTNTFITTADDITGADINNLTAFTQSLYIQPHTQIVPIAASLLTLTISTANLTAGQIGAQLVYQTTPF